MFGLKIFVRVQTFRRVPPVLPRNFCHPGYALGGHYIRKGRKWGAAGRYKGLESGLSIILVSMIDGIILVLGASHW